MVYLDAQDESEQIAWWNEKTALMLELEAALKARKNAAEAPEGETPEGPVKLALDKINEVNRHLIDLNSDEGEFLKHDWVPVSAFVTFESDNDYDKALKKQTIELSKNDEFCIKYKEL